jgi:hypothetical protein
LAELKKVAAGIPALGIKDPMARRPGRHTGDGYQAMLGRPIKKDMGIVTISGPAARPLTFAAVGCIARTMRVQPARPVRRRLKGRMKNSRPVILTGLLMAG